MSNVISTKVNDLVFYVFDNDWCGQAIIRDGYWDPHITNFLKRNLEEDSVFIDVGSNYGWYSIVLSNLCKKIYSFEPQQFVANLQERNIVENKITNIFLYKKAVCDTDSSLSLQPINYNSESLNIGDLSIGEGGEKVNCVSLDNIVNEKVDYIKIDAQGYEKFILKGAEKIIDKYYPTLIIEIEGHQLRKFGYSEKYIYDLLKHAGYSFYLLEYDHMFDHVCVHNSKLESFLSKNNNYIKQIDSSFEINPFVFDYVYDVITMNQ